MADQILVTIQLKNLDGTSKDGVAAALQSFIPAITENIVSAALSDKQRGCSFGGSVSTGPGGTTGTVTVTCS